MNCTSNNVLSEQAHRALDIIINGSQHLKEVEQEQKKKEPIDFIITLDFRSYESKVIGNARVYCSDLATRYFNRDFNLNELTEEDAMQILKDVEAELTSNHKERRIELLKEALAKAESDLAKAESEKES